MTHHSNRRSRTSGFRHPAESPRSGGACASVPPSLVHRRAPQIPLLPTELYSRADRVSLSHRTSARANEMKQARIQHTLVTRVDELSLYSKASGTPHGSNCGMFCFVWTRTSNIWGCWAVLVTTSTGFHHEDQRARRYNSGISAPECSADLHIASFW